MSILFFSAVAASVIFLYCDRAWDHYATASLTSIETPWMKSLRIGAKIALWAASILWTLIIITLIPRQ